MRRYKFDVILWDTVDPKTIVHYDIVEAIGEGLIDLEDGVICSTDDSVIIRQYTDLKDRKSREIYEGDIIQDKKKRKYIVTFNSEIGSWVNKPVAENATSYPCFNIGSVKGLEVIGNIFENPELLN